MGIHSQIVAGLANGRIVVLYSPDLSHNGAKLVMSKGPGRKVTIEDVSGALAAPTILTPHALPMFRDLDPGRGTKRKREKDRMDPRKSRRPELPVTGPGKGGRVGASATQHVVQNLVRDNTRDVDVSALRNHGLWTGANGGGVCVQPREALLRYADVAEKDPKWTGGKSRVFPNRTIYVAMGLSTVFSETLFFSLESESAQGSLRRRGGRERGRRDIVDRDTRRGQRQRAGAGLAAMLLQGWPLRGII